MGAIVPAEATAKAAGAAEGAAEGASRSSPKGVQRAPLVALSALRAEGRSYWKPRPLPWNFARLPGIEEGRSIPSPCPRGLSCGQFGSGAGVPGWDLILRKDGRSAHNPLAERHHRLVERAHDNVAREEPNDPYRFVSHIAQGVRHHSRDDSHIPRGDAAPFIPHRSLGLSLEDQEDLLGTVGVGPEPVARLELEVDDRRVLGSGSHVEGEVDLDPHRWVVLVRALQQLQLTDPCTNHALSPFDS